MKIKKFLLSLLCLSVSMTCMAQDSKWNGTASFDPIVTDFGNSNNLGFSFGAYHPIHENVSLGIGLGLIEEWKFKNAPAMPVFLGVHSELWKKDITPVFDLQMGYTLNFSNTKYGNIFLNPMIGMRFNNVGIGVGYYGQKVLQGNFKWGSGMNVRLCYYFNMHSTERSRNFKHDLDFSLELSGALPFGKDVTSGFGIGLNIALLYSVNKYVSIGLTTGFNGIDVEHKIDDYDKTNYSFSYVPIAVRGRYKFKQISSKIYPWLQLDLGGVLPAADDYLTSKFYYAPGLGASYEVRGGRSSIDLGISVIPMKVEEDMGSKVNILRFSLGYTF